ncbi:MAG: aminotransferase class V-fold PLP-dependent enzyme [Verrucomicrobiales bacterium]
MKLFVFPGNLDPDILRLGAHEVPYARTPAFGTLVTHCHQRLAHLTGAASAEVLSFTASGTGAVEALLAGWGPRWRRLLVLHAGSFGRRWYEMATHLGLPADDLSWPPNDEPPWSSIQAALATGRYDAVMAVHHETSTGECLDLSRLGRACHAAGVRLLVDAIGSFLADPLMIDSWAVDAVVLSSQKGLCLPPGLSFIIFRPTLGPPAQRSLSFYFDAHAHIASFTRGQPPWSPAAQIYAQLDRRLDQIDANGGAAAQQAAVTAKASAFRAALSTHGWPAAARHPSACLTALRFTTSATPLVHALADDQWFVLPSPDDTLVRVAHLGVSTIPDHLELADRLVHHASHLTLLPARCTAPEPALA